MSNQRKELSLKTMKVGESVVGYLKEFFKNPKGLSPDTENLVLVTKENEAITFWASGDVAYMKERMEKKAAPVGVLVKITRTAPPAGYKGRKKYFADIGFKLDDVKAIADLEAATAGETRATRSDDAGFEY